MGYIYYMSEHQSGIVEAKELGELSPEVQRILSHFELPGHELNIKGSAKYKHLRYKSDYDLVIALKKSEVPASRFFEDVAGVLHRIERNKDIYFIELKLETKDGEKKRLTPRQEIRMTWVERDYEKLAFAKIDTVARIENKFYEVSCRYNFREHGMQKHEVIRELEEDAEKLESEGNYYKVLKRLFSIYVRESNQSKLEYLAKVFNSPLGASYEKICNLKAMELVHQNYKDKGTARRISEGIRLTGETFRVGSINKHIKRLQGELNDEALKHLNALATT